MQTIFDHVQNVHGFHIILDQYPALSEGIAQRLGWLNILNPEHIDRTFKLNLTVRDEREMARVLVHLAMEEPGENWVDETYTRVRFGDLEDEPIAGWEMPKSWVEAEGGTVPHDGILTLTHVSDSVSAFPRGRRCGHNFSHKM